MRSWRLTSILYYTRRHHQSTCLKQVPKCCPFPEPLLLVNRYFPIIVHWHFPLTMWHIHHSDINWLIIAGLSLPPAFCQGHSKYARQTRSPSFHHLLLWVVSVHCGGGCSSFGRACNVECAMCNGPQGINHHWTSKLLLLGRVWVCHCQNHLLAPSLLTPHSWHWNCLRKACSAVILAKVELTTS